MAFALSISLLIQKVYFAFLILFAIIRRCTALGVALCVYLLLASVFRAAFMKSLDSLLLSISTRFTKRAIRIVCASVFGYRQRTILNRPITVRKRNTLNRQTSESTSLKHRPANCRISACVCLKFRVFSEYSKFGSVLANPLSSLSVLILDCHPGNFGVRLSHQFFV